MPKIKRSTRGKSIAKQPRVDESDLAAQEKALQKELRRLQQMADDKTKSKEFESRFEELEKRHQRALRNGKVDHDFEGFLDKSIADAKKQIKQLKVDLEIRKGETFRTLVPAGERPIDRSRSVALVVTLSELHRIISALRYTEKSFEIVNPGHRPTINDIESSYGKGELSGFLLRCALESGIGWATPAAPVHSDLGLKPEHF